jgi:hypothetical protein
VILVPFERLRTRFSNRPFLLPVILSGWNGTRTAGPFELRSSGTATARYLREASLAVSGGASASRSTGPRRRWDQPQAATSLRAPRLQERLRSAQSPKSETAGPGGNVCHLKCNRRPAPPSRLWESRKAISTLAQASVFSTAVSPTALRFSPSQSNPPSEPVYILRVSTVPRIEPREMLPEEGPVKPSGTLSDASKISRDWRSRDARVRNWEVKHEA